MITWMELIMFLTGTGLGWMTAYVQCLDKERKQAMRNI